MSDPKDRGVVDSIRALRERRYMERGPGAKRSRTKPSVEELRDAIARVPEKLGRKKKKSNKPQRKKK